MGRQAKGMATEDRWLVPIAPIEALHLEYNFVFAIRYTLAGFIWR